MTQESAPEAHDVRAAVSTSDETADRSRRGRAPGRWSAARLADVRAFDAVTWTVLAITALSALLHLWDLGARAYHHDEGQHAAFSFYFANGAGYQHDPLLHGPLNFDLIALAYVLFGDSDFTGRLPHALLGTLLVATPLLLRRQLGAWGTVTAAMFLTLSPSILYYARWAREDIFIALFTALIFAAVWRYRTDVEPRLRWLVLLSAAIALSYSTKESIYLTAAVLLLYLNAVVAHRLYWSRASSAGSSIAARVAAGLWLLPTAWIFAALWRPLAGLRRRLGFTLERPREVDLLVVTGTLVVPTLAAAVRLPLALVDVSLDAEAARVVAPVLVFVLLVAVAVIGWLWRWHWWLACAGVFLLLTVPFYATFGAHLPGVAGLFWNSLDYWLDQQEVQRGTQPWFYYLMMAPLYETLAFTLSMTGGLWFALRRHDHFAAMVLWWFAGTFVALSFAGEKMPWLTVHLALPLAFLAAYVV
ncbi:MAG: flippase activity-associated protein Agl23, partial [Dehalococcoidia bacterium]